MARRKQIWGLILAILLLPAALFGQDTRYVDRKTAEDIKRWEAKIKEYKAWLDLVRSDDYRLWVRLDGSHRPYRLYLGEGFSRVDSSSQQQFVETFSRFLAGHPEKYMLIDLYDNATGAHVGEFGWGGFKLYANGSSQKQKKEPDD
ncbi:MAG TPA: hypothetical protein VNL14_06415 [Candidatus Acidoferrales bacterium]|nr:hypothetical protein [Candidatus Acidoferrales bacterium]